MTRTTATRTVTEQTLGAWLLKARGNSPATDELIRRGFSTVTTRCVRRSYRTDLVKPGQPVLLWVSGSSAGIYAEGRTTGHALADPEDDGLVMPVRLRALAAPVLRSDLLQHPSLFRIEVLRMAAGSNPSFLTLDELAVLCADWPQVTVQ